MKERVRKTLWDLVALVGVLGLIYGALEAINVHGIFQGLVLAGGAAVLGYMAFELLYPMWFGRR